MNATANDLTGKVAIVTGGGRGLGRSMVLGLARAGANVVATAAREREELERVAEEARVQTGRDCVHAVVADVASDDDPQRVVTEALSRFGWLHIVVNNAARGMRYVSDTFMEEATHFWDVSPATWRMVIDTNVNGPFLMARAAVPHLRNAGWGRVINITMNQATMRRAGFSPYGPSKAALESETIIWSQDLADSGVTVNALSPGGATRTGMIPPGRPAIPGILEPDIIVPPLLWLASERSDGITGMRFVAARWRTDVAEDDAAEASRERAGWPSDPPQS